MFSRLAGKRIEKTNDDFDIDDMFESRANREVDDVAAEARERQLAIAQHEKREKVLDSCTFCLDSQVFYYETPIPTSHALNILPLTLGHSKTSYHRYRSEMLFVLACSSVSCGGTLPDYSSYPCNLLYSA